MENLEKTAPEAPAPASHDAAILTDDKKAQMKDWGIKGGVIIVVLLAVLLYRAHKQSSNEQASRMLGEARNMQALQAVITQYPSTPAARLALLQTAKAHYDSGDFMTASSLYQDFITKYPKHPLVATAELGKIECSEAMGKLPEALAAYSAFAASHAGTYLVPMALLGKGRCLEQSARYDEARAVYEDFLAANPKSPWKKDVEECLRHLDRETRKVSVRL
jgi:tetratricopeptide (TPR) repeat protein